ncbi:hypothetical protein ACFWJQ_35540 [Streptomyces goshikiensis]
MSVSQPPPEDDKDPSFWTRERVIDLAHELVLLGIRILQSLADGGCS